MTSIIVVGAGAAGLMAAKILTEMKYPVILLEALDRIGGRVDTSQQAGFTQPVEGGAEFVHGKLLLTMSLLKDAGLSYEPVKGMMYRAEHGILYSNLPFAEDWEDLLNGMKGLKGDMIFADFLQQYFPGERYAALRETATNYASGFDLADINTAATRDLYMEWSREEQVNYRINGGYGQLLNYLLDESLSKSAVFHTNAVVKQINWDRNKVTVITGDDRKFEADKVIITVPLGVLQASETDSSYITFKPSINKFLKSSEDIGYGAVIKIVLQFTIGFWEKNAPDAGFILGDVPVPTWWTQLPSRELILTGWLGGPRALKYARESDETLLQLALESLAGIFSISATELNTSLLSSAIYNWCDKSFSLGGYSFSKPASTAAREILNEPVYDTLFFAGEALYVDYAPATVEAALVSGKQVAAKVMASI